MKFKEYVGVKLSDHIIKDDNGQLICTYAIISREGEQKYWRHDLPKFDPKQGDYEVVLKRPWESVSEEESIRSFENKPVVVRHPKKGNIYVEDYDKEDIVGFVRDVMVGPEKINGYRVLIATLVITDASAIDAILSGQLREVSCGYDCDIDMDRWIVYNIRGNHVAIVPDGRAEIAQIMDAADDTLKKLHTLITKSGDVFYFNTANEFDNILSVKDIDEIEQMRFEGSIVNKISDLPNSYREVLVRHGFVGEKEEDVSFENEEINDSLPQETKPLEKKPEIPVFDSKEKSKEEVKMVDSKTTLLDETENKQRFIVKIKALSWDSNLIYKLILRFGLSRDIVITKPQRKEIPEDPSAIAMFNIEATKTPTHMTILHEYHKLFGNEILAKYDFDAFGNATKQEHIQWSLFQLFFTVKYDITIDKPVDASLSPQQEPVGVEPVTSGENTDEN